jgi:hypothetical protein
MIRTENISLSWYCIHQRKKVKTVFSVLKRKFGESYKSPDIPLPT